MRYQINGAPMPVVVVELEPGEKMIAEGGAMSWMSPNMQMETSAGGFGKAVGRMFSGEKMFQNIYTAVGGKGMISFASSFPGAILAVEITPDHPIIVQKSAFLACTEGVELSVHFQRKIGAGFFGGEGFIMQKVSGQGMVFLEIDGSTMTYDLEPGQKLIAATGYLAICDATVGIDVQSVKGAKNKLLGGEGFFNTMLTGPGKVTLQTMPASKFASAISIGSGNK